MVEALAPLEREAGSEGSEAAAGSRAARGRRRARRRSRRRSSSTATPTCSPDVGGRGGGGAGRAQPARAGARDRRRRRGRRAIADEVSNGLRPCAARSPHARRPGTWSPSSATRGRSGRSSSWRTTTPPTAGSPSIRLCSGSSLSWFPGVIERIDTAIPVWWGVAAGPGAGRGSAPPPAAAGWPPPAPRSRRSSAAAFTDIARHPVVPGRQRQPQRGRGAGRARRGLPRAAGRRGARRARLVRRRGGAPGRDLRLRRAGTWRRSTASAPG